MYTLLLLTFFTCKHRDPKEKPTMAGFWGYLNSLACILQDTHIACGSTKSTFQGHQTGFIPMSLFPASRVRWIQCIWKLQHSCSALGCARIWGCGAVRSRAAPGMQPLLLPSLRKGGEQTDSSRQLPPRHLDLHCWMQGNTEFREADLPFNEQACSDGEVTEASTYWWLHTQPQNEGRGRQVLQISRQQPKLDPHSDFTHFSSIIHILKSSGRNEEKLRLFQTLSARQVRAPTLSKETVTCNTKTIRKQTLVHNLQKKTLKKSIRFLLFCIQTGCRLEGNVRQRWITQNRRQNGLGKSCKPENTKVVLSLGENDLLHSTYNEFPSYNLKNIWAYRLKKWKNLSLVLKFTSYSRLVPQTHCFKRLLNVFHPCHYILILSHDLSLITKSLPYSLNHKTKTKKNKESTVYKGNITKE